MAHPLLAGKKTFPQNKIKKIKNYSYDFFLGAWIESNGDKYLINATGSSLTQRVSKKNDIETGEDQKGE